MTLALQAVLTIPETADPAQPFTEVQQGLSEPYGQVIDRLHDALEEQVADREAKDALLQRLAVENTNADCRKVLQALPMNATPAQMIEACCRVGSVTHHTKLLASAFAAALSISHNPRVTKNAIGAERSSPDHFMSRGKAGFSSIHANDFSPKTQLGFSATHPERQLGCAGYLCCGYSSSWPLGSACSCSSAAAAFLGTREQGASLGRRGAIVVPRGSCPGIAAARGSQVA